MGGHNIQSVCFAGLLLLCSCAQIVSPTGGLKDTTPPVVLKESPDNGTTLFNENKIAIAFDEYIQLANPEEQVVISPPPDTKPEYEISGKTLLVRIQGKLKNNTTYTINFGNAIADNHEGNILNDYRYVFATGKTIDTLGISGRVLLAENNEPQKNISICLYPVNQFTDSAIFLTKPAYFAKSKEGGEFRLYNLPQETFRLVAFADENKNLKYDKNEALAFISNPVSGSDSAKQHTLKLYKPDLFGQGKIVDTFSREDHKYTFLIYKPGSVLPMPETKMPYYTKRVAGVSDIDSFFVFASATEKDSLFFLYQEKRFLVRNKAGSKKPFFQAVMKRNIELNDSAVILLSAPVSSIDTSRIVLIEDTLTGGFGYATEPDKMTIKIGALWKENTRYDLLIKDSALKDIYGQYNKKVRINWVAKNLKDYSTLLATFDYTGTKKNLLIQLISSDDKLVFQSFYFEKNKSYFFDYLVPGSYRIKIIDDRNRNGKWDNGDYLLNRQPEAVYYHPETFNLRAYWDLEQRFNLSDIIID